MLHTITAGIEGEVEDSRIEGKVVVGAGTKIVRSVLRGPAIIGKGAWIEDAQIGPFTSIGDHVRIRASAVADSIILEGSSITDVEGRIASSLVGRNASIHRCPAAFKTHTLVLGDQSQVGL
jgi:glucose-1-phosphate thymidylyltransferase